uniref:Transmembrane domain-containing protein n=1 Tax=Trepomonas sp. PC1 TaxID=1076344 RepID=A0A146KCR0_9EUKA|eukprot:JAP93149.1 Transmembrane domain-containing protein [Trepomonas sp. PC1]
MGKPLSKRPIDWIILAFFIVNLGFITYIVDLEQLVVADRSNFKYPVWPPKMMIDLVHWWGDNFDPLLIARPPWWRATIWIDSILFGPFYLFAIYAIVKGKNWIRNPALIWCGLMFANVSIIMMEELNGPFHAKSSFIVTMANVPWWCLPIFVAWRFWAEKPFDEDLDKKNE